MSTQSTSDSVHGIFISHRSIDKEIANIFVDYLTNCGVNSDFIFCSSLPGNDVRFSISGEIKEHLKNSVLNILIVSNDYYESAYCQNESGIIWFLDTTKLIICMPEITEKNMEGFLNADNKIRRLDVKDDILFIFDVIKPIFSGITTSFAKVNANADKLILAYKEKLKCRIPLIPDSTPRGTNDLEKSILSDEFLIEELAALKYLHSNRSDVFNPEDKCFKAWLNNNSIIIDSQINICEYLYNSGIASIFEWYGDDIVSVKLENKSYRNLIKLSEDTLKYIDKELNKIIEIGELPF